jgi:hypothetical protein
MLVAREQIVCPQRGIQVMDESDIGRIVETTVLGQQTRFHKQFFGTLMTLFGQ